MAELTWAGRTFTVAPGDTVLDTLLAAGEPVSYSCKAGVCGSCLMQATSGSLPDRAQQGLKESWREQAYFLACVCQPEGDLAAAPVGEGARVQAQIEHVGRLSADVLEVRLAVNGDFAFRAGQFLTLRRGDGLDSSDPGRKGSHGLSRCHAVCRVGRGRSGADYSAHSSGASRTPAGKKSGTLTAVSRRFAMNLYPVDSRGYAACSGDGAVSVGIVTGEANRVSRV